MTAPPVPQGTHHDRRGPVARRPRQLLAAAVTVALLAPSLALAQTPREQELEARVAHLERTVERLLAAQEGAGGAETPGPLPQAPAHAAAAASPEPRIQSAPIMTAASPGTRFSYGGMIKFDAMATDTSDGRIADGGAGRLFYLPSAIPVGGDAGDGGDAYLDSHAQFSRFWLGADHVTDGGDTLKAMIEVDMFGGGAILGNESSTNTYGVTLRHAWVSWNNWLAGQTWSNFMDVAALPDSVDFVGPTDGTVFVRQAQLRYTDGPWSFSLENPETTVTPHGGGAQFRTGDNSLPDATARWTAKGDWGHFSVAGLLRQFKHGDRHDAGGALSVSGRYNLGAADDIRYALNAGPGIGRYLAFGLGSDVMADAGGGLHALDGYGGFVAWRHAFSPKLRGNLMYSRAQLDNDRMLTGSGVTEMAHSFHTNLIYSPLPKLDVGAELIFGQRRLEDGREGDLTRLHTHVKYTF